MAFPVPETLVKTSHSLTIRSGNVTVGLINGWNPAQNRGIAPIYQIGTFHLNVPSGEPVEKIPGNVTGQTIAVQRYDVYKQRMETAFGTTDLMMLTRQDRPFTVKELWKYPDDQGGGTEIIVYSGCWFSNIGRNYRSDGDRIINVNATLEYTKRALGQSA